MSENGKNSQNYISKVHLKGYKSIHDVEIDLLPGINIMIGANGSGKTNFLEFLDRAINYDWASMHIDINAEINLVLDENQHELKIFYEEGDISEITFDLGIKHKLLSNGSEEPNLTLKGLLWKNQIFFHRISFYTPSNLIGCNFSKLIEFRIHEDNSLFLTSHFSNSESNFNLIVLRKIRDELKKVLKENKLKEQHLNNFELLSVSQNLRAFSPIKNIRVSGGTKIMKKGNDFIIDYFSFEFLVNDNWLTWNQLSDGTQRLFYIISEISISDKGIYLIDEPELGLHPDQLHLVMTFLKKEAATKQIIIATHSPQVLDFLKLEELNRLIIARYGKNGTELVKLSEAEKGYFKKGLDEGLDFSDYWLNLGIEAEKVG